MNPVTKFALDRLPSRQHRLFAGVILCIGIVDGCAGAGLVAAGDVLLGALFLAVSVGILAIVTPLLFLGYYTAARVMMPYWASGVILVASQVSGAMRFDITIFVSAIYPFVVFDAREWRARLASLTAPIIFYVLIHNGWAAAMIRASGHDVVPYREVPPGDHALLIATYSILAVSLYMFSAQAARYEKRLRGAIDELELARARDALTNQNLTTLIRTVCHDIADKLFLAATTVDVAAEEGEGERRVRAFDTIREAHTTIGEVIENVRRVHLMRLQERPFEAAEVSLPQIFETCSKAVAHRLKAKDISLEIACDDWVKSHMVRADKNILSHNVLVNLLTNAIKFSHRGSTVRMSATRSPEDQVSILVEDSGIGIPPEIQAAIFDPSARASRPGTDNEAGTGLGLPIAASYVSLMGGSLSLKESRGGQGREGGRAGTTFEIILQAA